MATGKRLTEKHYSEKGYYLKCSGACPCDGMCDECDELYKAIDRLGEYEDKAEQTVDAVPAGAHAQVLWERDTAMMQLEEHGIPFGGIAPDVVKVVRCKDCVCYEEKCPGFGYCYHWDYEPGMSPNQVDGDDFCSYGERKDNESL